MACLVRGLVIFSLGTVGSSWMSGAVRAADLPGFTKAPPSIPYEWSGPYAGVSLGTRWSNIHSDTFDTFAFTPDPTTRSVGFDMSAFRGGFYAGYDWRVGPRWIAGFEGDLAWADKTRTMAGLPGAEGAIIGLTVGPNDFTSVSEKWDASVRGRFGYLVSPSLLLYLTGGVSWLRVEGMASCDSQGTNWCTAARSDSSSATLAGGTVGAGVEAAFRKNWRARAEYRYADYGSVTSTFFGGTVDQFSTKMRVTTQTALIGIAYRWDWQN